MCIADKDNHRIVFEQVDKVFLRFFVIQPCAVYLKTNIPERKKIIQQVLTEPIVAIDMGKKGSRVVSGGNSVNGRTKPLLRSLNGKLKQHDRQIGKTQAIQLHTDQLWASHNFRPQREGGNVFLQKEGCNPGISRFPTADKFLRGFPVCVKMRGCVNALHSLPV